MHLGSKVKTLGSGSTGSLRLYITRNVLHEQEAQKLFPDSPSLFLSHCHWDFQVHLLKLPLHKLAYFFISRNPVLLVLSVASQVGPDFREPTYILHVQYA